MKTLMAKKILKFSSLIAIVLAVGQISVREKVVGEHFVTLVKEGSHWCGNRLVQSKMFASLGRPEFLNHWFPVGEKYRGPTNQQVVPPVEAAKPVPAPVPERDEESAENGSEENSEAEADSDIDGEASQNKRMRKTELEPITASDQDAVLRILE